MSNKIYQCSCCNQEFYWGKNSRWYGKIEDEKGEVKPDLIACSEICYRSLKENWQEDFDDDTF